MAFCLIAPTLSALPPLPRRPRWIGALPGPLRLVFKAVAQLLVLLWMLLVTLPRPDVILLQVPPPRQLPLGGLDVRAFLPASSASRPSFPFGSANSTSCIGPGACNACALSTPACPPARPHAAAVQLPPALPTMLVCWLAAKRHRARLVFDWHNFAYSLMALGLGRRHPLVRRGSRAPAAAC